MIFRQNIHVAVGNVNAVSGAGLYVKKSDVVQIFHRGLAAFLVAVLYLGSGLGKMNVELLFGLVSLFDKPPEIILAAGVDSVGAKLEGYAVIVLEVLTLVHVLIVAPDAVLVVPVGACQTSCHNSPHAQLVRSGGGHGGEHVHIHKAGGSRFYHLGAGEHSAPVSVIGGKCVLTGHYCAEKPVLKGKVVRQIAEKRHIGVGVAVDKTGYRQLVRAVDHLVSRKPFGNYSCGKDLVPRNTDIPLGSAAVYEHFYILYQYIHCEHSFHVRRHAAIYIFIISQYALKSNDNFAF